MKKKLKYRRILLKLSGEVLRNRETGDSIDATRLAFMAERGQEHAPALEEIVIVEFAAEEAVGAGADGVAQQEGAGTAAQGHTPDLPPVEGGMAQALHAEAALHAGEEVRVALRLRQFADQAGAGVLPFQGRKPAEFLQAEQSGNPVVHPTGGVVQAGVGGIDGDAGREGLDHAALLVRGVRDLAERLE